MKTSPFVLSGVTAFLLLLLLLPLQTSHAAKTPAPKGKPLPSARLRQMIDKTLPQIASLANGKAPGNSTALTEAQAEWTALAQTAPAAEQATYAAAANLVQMLIAAEAEHTQAIATDRYSKKVHGPQDKKDAEVSNPQRGWDAGALARADNAKQNKENADSRKALLDKEKFMNQGAVVEWKARTEQIRAAVEQAYLAELVTEKQMVAARVSTPAPAPPPPKRESSAADAYSPTGTWTGPKGKWTLNEDGSFSNTGGASGTWHWSDPGKRELELKWAKGGEGKGVFSADGKSLEVTSPQGKDLKLTR